MSAPRFRAAWVAAGTGLIGITAALLVDPDGWTDWDRIGPLVGALPLVGLAVAERSRRRSMASLAHRLDGLLDRARVTELDVARERRCRAQRKTSPASR